MKGDGTPLDTIPLKQGASKKINLQPDHTAVYTFTAVWGSNPGETATPADDAVGQGQPNNSAGSSAGATDTVYIVQSGDTLWEIAKQYGTTSDKIAAYNGIEHAEKIQIGDIIHIPPADYQAPEKTAPLSSQTTESQTESKSTKPTEALDLDGEHR